MAQFRFIIVGPFNSEVQGTNDEEVAKKYSEDEDLYVVDTETGKWFNYDTGECDQEVVAVETDEEEEEEDEEEDEDEDEDDEAAA